MEQKSPSPFLPFLLASSGFMQMLDATILNTALPTIAHELNASPLKMQTIIIAYSLSVASVMPLSGFLSDRFGSRNIFISALSLFTIGSLFCALSPTLKLLTLSRIIQGLGGAMLLPVARLIILRSYEKDKLLSIINLMLIPALIGPVLGPLLGGYLVEYASWHWIFLINLPIGLLSIALCYKILPNLYATNKKSTKLDQLGFILFAFAAIAMTLAAETLSQDKSKTLALILFALSISAFYGYWRHAQHDPNPLYTPKLLQVRTYRLGLMGNLISRLGISAIPFLLPLMLQLDRGYSASTSGWLLAPIAIASIIAKPIIKPLMNRYGYRRALIYNTRLLGLLILCLAYPKNIPLPLLIGLLFLIGFSNSIQFSAMNTIAISKLRDWQAGSGNSLLAVNQQLAISLGIALGALFLNLSHQNLTQNLHYAFCLSYIFLATITILSSFVFNRLHPQDGANLLNKKNLKK